MAGTLKAEATLAAANLVFLLLLVGGGVIVPLDKFPGRRPACWDCCRSRRSPTACGTCSSTAPAMPWGDLGILAVWAVAGAGGGGDGSSAGSERPGAAGRGGGRRGRTPRENMHKRRAYDGPVPEAARRSPRNPLAFIAARWTPIPGTVRRAALAALVMSVVIVITGGAVRLTGSGLGCPTWPKCTRRQPAGTRAMGIHGAIEFSNRMLTYVLCAAVGWAIIAVALRASRAGAA